MMIPIVLKIGLIPAFLESNMRIREIKSVTIAAKELTVAWY